MTEDTPTPRIELYVRSLLPDGAHERQEAVIDQLDRLEREDEIAGYNVVVWGKQVATESAAANTEEGKYILNRVAEFKQWALSNNVSLESFYQNSEVDSEVTDDAYDTMVLPVMGLAEYHEGELAHVAPCTKGDVVHTIMDRLERLEEGEPSALEQTATDVSIV
ncbi:HTH domain-containing protein [Haloarcula amylovorans]|uniref:HTH domain-containing protein n=1 Tax=Haloarcula amylovorans TaxID=2562280 RepID=UPI0010762A76|nr:HTH domain-containing protein [Halomicroarcula amylolytica]